MRYPIDIEHGIGLWIGPLPIMALILPYVLGVFMVLYLSLPYDSPSGDIGMDIFRGLALIYLCLVTALFTPLFLLWEYTISIFASIVSYVLLRKRAHEPRVTLWSSLIGAAVFFFSICLSIICDWDILEGLRLIREREDAEVTMNMKIGTCLVWFTTFIVAFIVSLALYKKIKKRSFACEATQRGAQPPSRRCIICRRIAVGLFLISMCSLVIANIQWLNKINQVLTWNIVHGKVEQVEGNRVFFSYDGLVCQKQFEAQPNYFHPGEEVRLLGDGGRFVFYPENDFSYFSFTAVKIGGIGTILALILLLTWGRIPEEKRA